MVREGKQATRRHFLGVSAGATIATCLSPHSSRSGACASEPGPSSLAESDLATVPFVGEGSFPLETLVGAGLGQRRALDLTALSRETAVIPQERFFVRTGSPHRLPEAADWRVRLRGLLEKPVEVPVKELLRETSPQGVHLLECAGNSRNARFGLMSAAHWTGIPLTRLLERVRIQPRVTQVLVSGVDEHHAPEPGSLAGAGWIFSLDRIREARAFLATEMNGAPLTREHGHPLRLVVPGWYGCTAIKWVDEIVLVGEDAPATTQMREFAGRTHQDPAGPRDLHLLESGQRPEGPELARDFKPATVDPAALPLRVEKIIADGAARYLIRGILWGPRIAPGALRIRVEAGPGFVPVEEVEDGDGRTWAFWSHTFQPSRSGRHRIELAVVGEGVRTRRLDMGFYAREFDL